MSDEQKDLLVESLARELPRREPGAETILRISAAIHGQAKPSKRTEFGPVLDVEELAEFLRVDEGALEEYVDEIPCFELGGKLLFRRASVERWIEGRERAVGVRSLQAEFDRAVFPASKPSGGGRWKL